MQKLFAMSYRYPEAAVTLEDLPSNAAGDGRTLAAESENAWRWEGGGMLARGYIDAQRLAEGWFSIMKCYPA